MPLRQYLTQVGKAYQNKEAPEVALKALLIQYLAEIKVEAKSSLPISNLTAGANADSSNQGVSLCERIITCNDDIELMIQNIFNQGNHCIEMLNRNNELCELFRAFFVYYNYRHLLTEPLQNKLAIISSSLTQEDVDLLCVVSEKRFLLVPELYIDLLDKMPAPHRKTMINNLLKGVCKDLSTIDEAYCQNFSKVFALLEIKEQEQIIQEIFRAANTSKRMDLIMLLATCIKCNPEYLKNAEIFNLIYSSLKEAKEDRSKDVFSIIYYVIEAFRLTNPTQEQSLGLLTAAALYEPMIALEPQNESKKAKPNFEIEKRDAVYHHFLQLFEKQNTQEACETIMQKIKNPKIGCIVLLGNLAVTLKEDIQGSFDRYLRGLYEVEEDVQQINTVMLQVIRLNRHRLNDVAIESLYDQSYKRVTWSNSYNQALTPLFAEIVSLLTPEMAYKKLEGGIEDYSDYDAGTHLQFLFKWFNHFPLGAREKLINERLIPYIEEIITGIKRKVIDTDKENKSSRMPKLNMSSLSFTHTVDIVCSVNTPKQLKSETRQRLRNLIELLFSNQKLSEYTNSHISYLKLAQLLIALAPQEAQYFLSNLYKNYIETVANVKIVKGLCCLISQVKDNHFYDINILCNLIATILDQNGNEYDRVIGICSVLQALIPQMNHEQLQVTCNALLPHYRNFNRMGNRHSKQEEFTNQLVRTLGCVVERLPAQNIKQDAKLDSEAKDEMPEVVKTQEEFADYLFHCGLVYGTDAYHLILRPALVTKKHVDWTLRVAQGFYHQSPDGSLADEQRFQMALETFCCCMNIIQAEPEKFISVFESTLKYVLRGVELIKLSPESCKFSLKKITDFLDPYLKLTDSQVLLNGSRIFIPNLSALCDAFKNKDDFWSQLMKQLLKRLDHKTFDQLLKAQAHYWLDEGISYSDRITITSHLMNLHHFSLMETIYPILGKESLPTPVIRTICEYIDSSPPTP